MWRVVITGALSVAPLSSALAWGDDGHGFVCEIAFLEMRRIRAWRSKRGNSVDTTGIGGSDMRSAWASRFHCGDADRG